MHGLMVQMFNHGISITGLWLIVQMIENRWGTRDMTKVGGMATIAPQMSIALVILAFANISLPLTNSFIGEFMLFHGIFQMDSSYHIVYMAVAGLAIILGAAYTLRMVQRTAFGNTSTDPTTTRNQRSDLHPKYGESMLRESRPASALCNDRLDSTQRTTVAWCTGSRFIG